MVGQLRLWSGLVLFLFVLGHFINHALGIVSLDAMEAGLTYAVKPWRTLPGTALLATALTVHILLAAWSLYRRRSLRMRASDAVQVILGLLIPIVIGGHVMATRGAHEVFDAKNGYAFEVAALWVVYPGLGLLNAVALLTVWVHACIGWHYWLRLRPWYPRFLPYAFAGALLVPALALAGYVAAGFRVRELAQDQAWIDKVIAAVGVDVNPMIDFVFFYADVIAYVTLATVAAILLARQIRAMLEARAGGGRLVYLDPVGERRRELPIRRGHTLLEMLRAAGIPHAAVCGGRGRCSTCRVRVGAGADHLDPPGPDEAHVLRRVAAPPGVRLACQLQPTAGLEITPLLPSTATARDGFQRPGYLGGEEREVAVLFADIRAFTELAEDRLPYDIVFVLNRYFAAMGKAVEDAGGRLDKFIGDGVMALFGVDTPIDEGCRRAVTCARLMAERLDELNASLAGDLREPLRIGIGIHAGPVILGEMGYARANHLTAVGATVNVASRLEDLTKRFSVQLVLSDTVAARSGYDFTACPREIAEIRGSADRIPVRVVTNAGHLSATPTAAVS